MVILLVGNTPNLTLIWARHLERLGNEVTVTMSQAEAVGFLRSTPAEVIVLDLMLEDGSAIAVADYASYRWPDARIVFVTSTAFFSDGSIFNHIPNAAAMVKDETPPADLAAIVEYHGRAV